GIDRRKDQSYILSGLNQEKLSKALFPVGGYTKNEIRFLARDLKLPVADKSESMDLCFITSGDYREFIARHAPEAAVEGDIVDSHGEYLGTHQGLANYTIGQRKGLGLSSPVPLYVVSKDPVRNVLVVGESHELGRTRLFAEEANWISKSSASAPFRAEVQIRYRSEERAARIEPISGSKFEVRFDEPVRGITPGQLAVIYDGEKCLGGGIIKEGFD
ncbi:MAG: aminomethyltransferase beta-barrel domain-containing protein, partial [Anaerolineales bacterium]|nr:aminomethyltransferase beta-barrel domain-containing protein [Anaerolineales bacterium]